MVKLTHNQIHLHWKASSEFGNDRFEIEKSMNGNRFYLLNALKGKGTSINNCYHFIDIHPEIGINYYRLKQVDFDGTTTVLDIKTIQISSRPKILAF